MKLRQSHIESAARSWWLSLQSYTDKAGRERPGNRAALARLRRAGETFEATGIPETHDLFRRLALFEATETPNEAAIVVAFSRVSVIASVLAHVRKEPSGSEDADAGRPRLKLGRALGPADPKKPESAVLKPLRLGRLLAARGDEEIGTACRRAVAMLGGTANVGDLAWLMLTWDHDELGDRVRTLFAYDYYDATAHAPAPPGAAPRNNGPASADAATATSANSN